MKKTAQDYCKYYYGEEECPYPKDHKVACLFWQLEKDFFHEYDDDFRGNWIRISNGKLPWNRKDTPDFPRVPKMVKGMLWFAWDTLTNVGGYRLDLVVQYGKELPDPKNTKKISPITNVSMDDVKYDNSDSIQTIMLWKLGLGNMSKFFMGEEPMPPKDVIATAESWKTEDMPPVGEDVSDYSMDMIITEGQMDIIRKGHMPEVQEDHWFMYCDDEYIRYYRSWTGMCAFEAHYIPDGVFYKIDNLKINRNLAEFGVNGNDAGAALFRYLICTETGSGSQDAWEEYLEAWNYLNNKYKPKGPDEWYGGIEGKVCEGCMYSGGIRRWNDDDPNSEIAGCGRLFRESFKKSYLYGECMFKQKECGDPSEFEKQKQKEWAEKKTQKKVSIGRNKREYYDDFSIAGFKFADGLMVFDQLKVGMSLKLVREPDNNYDKNAIAIFYGEHKLGYVPRIDNKELSKFLDMGWAETFDCRINRISTDRNPNDQIGVTVFINKNL